MPKSNVYAIIASLIGIIISNIFILIGDPKGIPNQTICIAIQLILIFMNIIYLMEDE